jgi:hypothetical protein
MQASIGDLVDPLVRGDFTRHQVKRLRRHLSTLARHPWSILKGEQDELVGLYEELHTCLAKLEWDQPGQGPKTEWVERARMFFGMDPR